MNIADVVARIKAVIDADKAAGGKLSERAVSMAATGSTDTIRNWRRAFEAGKDSGATTPKVEAVAEALGVSPTWLLTGEGAEDEFPDQYRLLSPANKAVAQATIRALLEAQRAEEQ